MKLFISKLLIRVHQHSQLFLLWNPFHCNKRYLTTCTYVYWYLSAPNFQIQYHIAFANHLHLNCIHQRFQKWSTNISWNFQPILTCLNNTIRKKKTFPLACIHKHASAAIMELFTDSLKLFAQSPRNFPDMVFTSICVKKGLSQNGTGKALSILLKWWRIMGWNERQYVKLWDLSLTFLLNYTAISKMFPQYGLLQWR